MKKTLQYLLVMGLLLLTATVSAQVTTSSINGRVLDRENEALLGATIIALHTPSGTNYATTTDMDGRYRIANMRVGGPYIVTITYVGKKEEKLQNIFLQLGNSEKIDVVMTDEQNALDAIVIDATRDNVFDSGKTGTSTNISQRDLNNMPSATRGLGDFLRKTPQARVGENGSISLGGQNNRYNSIFLDGAVNNDVFGLADSGTNGGQIGVNPLSIDAIESFQVNLAPFDVRQSGFAGGSINAITRSGTNNTEGSAYAYIRDQNLAGKTPTGIRETDRTKLDDFSTQLIGARVGGAIIKDKLFYFVNYENQDDSTPRPFDPSTYTGNSSIEDLDALRQNLLSVFGYDAGDFRNNVRTLKSDKFTIRLDYNLDDKNTITLKNNYVSAESVSPGSSNPRTISFENNGIAFPSTTNSTTLEWSTTNGSNLSNNLIVGYTTVNDDRNQMGSPFPNVRIDDGPGNIFFGSEAFSTANLLEQKVLTVTNNFEIFTGKHNITFGANFEHYDMLNVFVRQNFGAYRFRSLADFNTYFDNDPSNDRAPRDYDYTYSLLDPAGTSGDDITNAAAKFKYSQLGLYVQDEWSVTDNFRLTYGLRFDIPYFENGIENEDFNTRTVALLEEAGKDLQGARVGRKINSNIHFSPRAGFNWDVKGDKTSQVRGGLGIFTSRMPLAWPGGAYNNNGVSLAGVDERNTIGGAGATRFVADPSNQPLGNGAVPGSGQVGGQIDIFSPDFKLPQVFKMNIGLDQKLGVWGLIASVDFLYNETINNILYQNLNIDDAVGTLNGADNRPFYNRNAPIDPTYTGIYLATNTNEGYSYNGTFTLTKPVEKGFGGQLAYTYGDGRSIFEGTSSQNSSQWRNIRTVNGKNGPLPTAPSEFATGHRISANLSYEYKWNDNIKTTLGLFVNAEQGNTISYVYNNSGANILNDDSTDGALIYIPRNQSEINLVPLTVGTGANAVTFTPQQQWEALDAFISSRDYLNERRGGYAEANGDRGPFNTTVDLKVLQDFSLDFGTAKKHTFQVSLDMFNFLNFLNKDWGEIRRIGGTAAPIETRTGGPNPTFSYNPNFATNFEFIDDGGVISSRWQAQIGLRYIFN